MELVREEQRPSKTTRFDAFLYRRTNPAARLNGRIPARAISSEMDLRRLATPGLGGWLRRFG